MSERFKMYGSVEQLESLNKAFLDYAKMSHSFDPYETEDEELGTKVGLNIVSDLQEIEELKKNLTK